MLRPVDVAGHRAGRPAAAPLLRAAGEPVVGGLGPERVEDRVEQRQVDHLAPAAVHLHLPERRHGREGASEAGDRVGEIHRRQDGLAIREAVHVGEAREPLDQRAETGTTPVGSCLAPTRNPHDHEPRLDRVQLGGRETHGLERSRPEALDQHGGPGNELADQRDGVRMPEVEAEAALVARMDLPGRLDAVDAPAPQRVTVARLDLDDVGAEIGEVLAEQVAGDEAGQVDDPHAFQGARRGGAIVIGPGQDRLGFSGMRHGPVQETGCRPRGAARGRVRGRSPAPRCRSGARCRRDRARAASGRRHRTGW